ncbi:MAG: hypothetical protein ACKVI4_15080, partial [Actinomycetales bacterium]|tara:strand:- start:90 stop:581 length:492 start_codon:yes stop_codon:yes gene_type:complete
VTERQLLASWSRMLPELLRFSSRAHLLADIPDELQKFHRLAPNNASGAAALTDGSMQVVEGVLAEEREDQPTAVRRRKIPGMSGSRERRRDMLREQQEEQQEEKQEEQQEEQTPTDTTVEAVDGDPDAFQMFESTPLSGAGGLCAALADQDTEAMDLSMFGFS